MFFEDELNFDISDNFIDFVILGSYKNEPLLEEFLNHLFYEKKIITEQILDIDFFKNYIENNYIDVILPLSSLPKNFYNDNNTFLDKKEKFFQINITFPNNGLMKELNNFLKSFSQLIQNTTLISFIRNNNDTLPHIKQITKNNIQDIDIDKFIEIKNNNVIKNLSKSFKSNYF